MGIDGLLRALKKVLIQCTANMQLKVNPDTGDREEDFQYLIYTEGLDKPEEAPEEKEPTAEAGRPPHVFLMNTPERSDLVSQIPYLMIQLLNGKDKRNADTGDEESTANVRILVATYNDDGEDGGLQVLEIIERIRIMLFKGRLLDQQYMIQHPFDYEIYPDDTGVYYLGEINTVWSVPTIERTAFFIEDCLKKGD